MPGKISIRGLRNIKSLDFDIPDRGVWLLTAGNGAGKTSLLACVRRIGHPNAFPVHFASSLKSDRLDNHSEGSVVYEINGESVEYAYRGQRWTPRPRSNANLFDRFGYDSVTYVGANADRITPRPEDFDTRLIRSAPRQIVNAANEIFGTEKFNRLRTINLSRGASNEVFVLALETTPISYHSEKHFSLGELCVLKLLRLLTQINNNSMVIVDELEMALHPKAQVNLLKFLERQASQKSLTVVFSTHSVTLLKSIDRKRIIYLEETEGITKPVYGCYPTYAIGNIASDEETLPDTVIYVEDVFARDIVNAFFEVFSDDRFKDPTERPTVKVVPVGGFQEVVAFLDRNRSVLPNRVKQFALLDEDVSSETVKNWKATDNHALLAKFQRLEKYIEYLPFTPEVGLLVFAKSNASVFEKRVRERFSDNQLRLISAINKFDSGLSGKQMRSQAKQSKNDIFRYLEERTQKNEDSVRDTLCGVFAQLSWKTHANEFKRLFGPMV